MDLQTFVETYNISPIADLASLGGVFVSALGFFLTILNILKTKSLIKRKLGIHGVISDAATAISKIDEIMDLQRDGNWKVLPKKYTELRRLITSIRSSGVKFTEEQDKIFQAAITHFSTIENSIEKNLMTGSTLPISKIHKVVSEQSDKLHGILISIKREI